MDCDEGNGNRLEGERVGMVRLVQKERQHLKRPAGFRHQRRTNEVWGFMLGERPGAACCVLGSPAFIPTPTVDIAVLWSCMDGWRINAIQMDQRGIPPIALAYQS